MSNGLSDTGFEIQSWAENVSDYETLYQNAISNPSFTIEDNEYVGQLLKVIAGRETKCWQALLQIYQIWTRSGAEGVYLDEMFALNGIFRESATAGSGNAVVQVDTTADSTTVVESGASFTGSNGIQYATSEDITISENLTALRIKGSSASLDEYTIAVTDGDGNDYSTTITLGATADTSRLAFLESISDFLTDISEDDTVYIDEDNLVLYWGFDESYSLTGLSSTVTYTTSPQLGNMYGSIECTAETTGYYALPAGGITTMSTTPDGYVSVTNLDAFSSGSNIETDAAFVERASESSDSPRSSVKSAIVSSLLSNVSDVESVVITKTVTDGIVTVTPIIVGGATADIAEELESTQPINNHYSGTTSYTVTTTDGEEEIIKFTRGTTQELYVKVEYSTANDTDLTDDEESTAISNMTDVADSWELGELIFPYTLQYAVAEAIDTSTITSLTIYIGESTSSYSTSKYQADDAAVPELSEDNIVFDRVDTE